MSSDTARIRSRLGFGIDSDWRESRSRMAWVYFMDGAFENRSLAQFFQLRGQRGDLVFQRGEPGALLVHDVAGCSADEGLVTKLGLNPGCVGLDPGDPPGESSALHVRIEHSGQGDQQLGAV